MGKLRGRRGPRKEEKKPERLQRYDYSRPLRIGVICKQVNYRGEPVNVLYWGMRGDRKKKPGIQQEKTPLSPYARELYKGVMKKWKTGKI